METINQILEQKYLTSKDLSIVTGMKRCECLKVIDACRKLMLEKNLFVPGAENEHQRNRKALTSIIRKYLGI